MIERTQANWIQTASGRQFFPLDPKPAEVFIEDIAHGLSNMCRFNGHTRSFYSVAQHSIIVSNLVPKADALWGLLHDASEAYIADITRPVKPYLSNYAEIEEGVMRAIASRFALAWPMPNSVKKADIIALATEKRDLMGTPPAAWSREFDVEAMDEGIYPFEPTTARILFLQRYREIVGL